MSKVKLEIRELEINLAALRFKAITNQLRLQFLLFLHKKGSVAVQEIYRHFKIEQSVTSQHLAILRRAGLVETQKEGRQVFYRPDYQNIQKLHEIAFLLLGKPQKADPPQKAVPKKVKA